ncbi:two-component system, unclassified family, sensor kinase [Flavobacterium gillisiae]|uniref:histidine kinase n=1 Tax=Flavobacterium gillisiae TaxID=150146 RepID=A0A1H3X1P9_9FLAO|nr:hybrid sensor histidine kinase/response regulator [Flavobacterium gillisiae]SDZ93317.1 two-component system, unclassified family, sensor kinase [Flavobacterium gillisiae]
MNKSRILIIDDELNIREVITEVLSLNNYQTKTAKNGQVALDILDDWTPDLIICDIMMPVMDGLAFQKIVYSDKLLSTIPFVFLTAKVENNLMRNCFHVGADDFLTKPFEVKELLKTVQSKIERFKKIKNTTNLYIGESKNFSHEINTPLNGILGSIDLLMDDTAYLKQEEIIIFHEEIKTYGERLNRTMQNIIHFENIKNNQFKISENDCAEIKNVFKNILNKISFHYKKQKNRVVSELTGAELAISSNNLSFILFELLDNALKFSPENKKVVIEGSIFSDDYYEINIFDYGVGFKEEELKLIDATVQFNHDEREQQGLGLGLFITKSIIKKSNGIISIVSKENEGAKISILLPIHKK